MLVIIFTIFLFLVDLACAASPTPTLTATSTATATATKVKGQNVIVLLTTPESLSLNYTFSSQNIVQVPYINSTTTIKVNFTCDMNTVNRTLTFLRYLLSDGVTEGDVCNIVQMTWTNCSSWSHVLVCTSVTARKFQPLALGKGDVQMLLASTGTASAVPSSGSDTTLFYLFFLLFLIPIILCLLWAWRHHQRRTKWKKAAEAPAYPWLTPPPVNYAAPVMTPAVPPYAAVEPPVREPVAPILPAMAVAYATHTTGDPFPPLAPYVPYAGGAL